MTIVELLQVLRSYRHFGILTRDQAAQVLADHFQVSTTTAARLLGAKVRNA